MRSHGIELKLVFFDTVNQRAAGAGKPEGLVHVAKAAPPLFVRMVSSTHRFCAFLEMGPLYGLQQGRLLECVFR